MAEPARKLVTLSKGFYEGAEEEAPPSQERPKSEEEAAAESGEFEKIETVLGGWKTRAVEDIQSTSSPAIDYVRTEAPDIAIALEEDQKRALDELESATEQSKREASRFVTGAEAELPSPEPFEVVHEPKWEGVPSKTEEQPTPVIGEPVAPETHGFVGVEPKEGPEKVEYAVTSIEQEEIPEHIKTPESEVEYVEMQHQLKNVQKELDGLFGISAAERTEKNNIRRALLVNEHSMMKKTLERYEIENDIRTKELKLDRLDGRMLELLKQAPANDVESLPPEQKKQAKEIQRERAKLEASVQEQREYVAEIAAAILGLDRLLTQSKAQLRSLEEAEAAEAAKKEEEARQKAEEAERARKAAEEERAAKTEKEKPGAFKRGAKKGIMGVAIGVAVSLFSVSKIMKGIDKGLEYLFAKDWVDKARGWWRKLTFAEDKDDEKKPPAGRH